MSPCPKCGSTQTDSVAHGLAYAVVWKFGYRLRRCSRCRAPRFLPRNAHANPETTADPADEASQRIAPNGEVQARAAGNVLLQPDANQAIEPAEASLSRESCPRCGSTSYRRSTRTFFERLLLRPKMARCRKCRQRFRYPES